MTSSNLSLHDVSLLQAQYCEHFARLTMYTDQETALDWISQGIEHLQSDSRPIARYQRGALNVVASTVWGQLLGDFVQARAFAESGLELLPEKASAAQLTAYINLGIISIQSGAVAQGRQHLAKGIRAAEQLRNLDKLAALHINMGIAERRLGNWEQSLVHQEKACQIYKQIGNNDRAGSTYVNMGMVYLMRCDYPNARNALKEAQNLATTHNLRELEAFAQTTQADLCVRNNEFNLANELLESAKATALSLSGTDDLLTSINRLEATVALKKKAYDDALKTINVAIGAAQAIGFKQEEGIALSIKGEILDAKKQFSEAACAHQKSLACLEDQDPYEFARAICSYAQHCRKSTKPIDAALYDYLNRARNIFDELNAKHELEKLETLLANN